MARGPRRLPWFAIVKNGSQTDIVTCRHRGVLERPLEVREEARETLLERVVWDERVEILGVPRVHVEGKQEHAQLCLGAAVEAAPLLFLGGRRRRRRRGDLQLIGLRRRRGQAEAEFRLTVREVTSVTTKLAFTSGMVAAQLCFVLPGLPGGEEEGQELPPPLDFRKSS